MDQDKGDGITFTRMQSKKDGRLLAKAEWYHKDGNPELLLTHIFTNNTQIRRAFVYDVLTELAKDCKRVQFTDYEMPEISRYSKKSKDGFWKTCSISEARAIFEPLQPQLRRSDPIAEKWYSRKSLGYDQ